MSREHGGSRGPLPRITMSFFDSTAIAHCRTSVLGSQSAVLRDCPAVE